MKKIFAYSESDKALSSSGTVTFYPDSRTRRLLVGVMATIIALLVLGSVLGEIARLGFGRGSVFGLVRLFGLGQEANVPTWYSSAALLFASLFTCLIAFLPIPEVRRQAKRWWALAAVIALMSLDETALLHEGIPYFVALSVLSPEEEVWYIDYAWVPLGTVVLGLLVWWFLPLWRSFPSGFRYRFGLAAFVFFAGALGLEFLEAAWASQFDTETFGYSALWTVQETLELTGVALLILAFFDYLSMNGFRAQLTVDPN